MDILKRGETDVLIADLDMPGNRQLELLHAWRISRHTSLL